MNDMWEIENSFHNEGFNVICGVDEAGRGPLAGPVCAAAVILPQNLIIEGLDDSKKLSEKKREQLFDIIKTEAISYGIAFSSVEEIETLNILGATYLAMNRAIKQLNTQVDLALIDGNKSKEILVNNRTIVKGDSLCACISAASILAKVTRDRYMYELSEKYPQYGFDKHKGYGTKDHYAAIREFGISEVHRQSFLKKMH